MNDFTAIPQLARNIARVAEIARVLVKYGLGDWLARLDSSFVKRWARGTEIARISTVSHEARIRLVLTELGTTFIKFGQVLSTRLDLVGPELASELSLLQSNVPADPPASVRHIVETEVKRPIAELFAEFDEVPIASGSIGQVHRATLHDGRRVVLKVQHPGIIRRIHDDLSILQELASLAERFLPEVRQYRPLAVVAEFERVLLRELDFCRELRYLQMFRQAFAEEPDVYVPEPYPAYSTGRVLTMEFLDGIPFARIEEVKAAGGDPEDLARRGSRIFLAMIFRDGFFHADPHPGNLFYLPPREDHPFGRIGLLDVGMVGRIDNTLRERIERGISAILHGDAAQLTELVMQIGDTPPHLDIIALEGDIAEQLAFYWGMPLDQFQLGNALDDLTAAIRRYHVMLPAPLALLLRVLIILEGTARLLSPKFNLAEMLEPYRQSFTVRRTSPRRLLRRILVDAQDWHDLLHAMPRQLSSILKMVNRQELGVQLSHRHLEPSVNRLAFGLMISALFVGSSMMWASKTPPLLWDNSVFGVLGCLAGLILGARLFRAIQHSGRLEQSD
jgi:ubiquinone biosynthesis protein